MQTSNNKQKRNTEREREREQKKNKTITFELDSQFRRQWTGKLQPATEDFKSNQKNVPGEMESDGQWPPPGHQSDQGKKKIEKPIH